MKKLFLLCFCILSLKAFGQVELPVDSAFDNFHKGNYPKAIKLYKELVARNHYLYQMDMLALCYIKTDSIAQAKDVLEKVISSDSKMPLLDASSQSDCCQKLAEIYLKEKDYRKAMSLYKRYDV